jgi:hypothetical protein
MTPISCKPSSAHRAPGRAVQPWRPLGRLLLAPAIVILAFLPMSCEAMNAHVWFVFLPLVVLAAATCHAAGAFVVALFQRRTRHAAVEAALALVMGLGTALSFLGILGHALMCRGT